MSHDRWRCFIAIPIGDRLRADLSRAVATWRADPAFAGLRWTDPDAWHLTLAFLGWTDPGAVASILASMRTVSDRASPATLATGGLGAFPSPGRARVVWYGIDDPHGVLADLSIGLHQALGLDVPEAFRAHVTLARARREPLRLRDAFDGLVAPPGRLAVEEMRLMRSHLGGNRPARYEMLESVRIGSSVHV
jgi:2'-5' RNA ligase